MTAHRLSPMRANALVARDGDIFIAAQPTEADLDAWAAQGVKLVVNLRSRAENAALPYRATEAMQARGMAYVEIPMGGADGVTPAVREKLTETLATAAGPTVLHCGGGPRCVYAYAAHLLAEGQATPEDIENFGWPGGLDPDVLQALLPE